MQPLLTERGGAGLRRWSTRHTGEIVSRTNELSVYLLRISSNPCSPKLNPILLDLLHLHYPPHQSGYNLIYNLLYTSLCTSLMHALVKALSDSCSPSKALADRLSLRVHLQDYSSSGTLDYVRLGVTFDSIPYIDRLD